MNILKNITNLNNINITSNINITNDTDLTIIPAYIKIIH